MPNTVQTDQLVSKQHRAAGQVRLTVSIPQRYTSLYGLIVQKGNMERTQHNLQHNQLYYSNISTECDMESYSKPHRVISTYRDPLGTKSILGKLKSSTFNVSSLLIDPETLESNIRYLGVYSVNYSCLD